MQEDFHYYCTGVLARAAGFNSEDALIIAYASQYVDDATESELIRLDVKESDLKFDPVRTCYRGLESVLSLSWSAQKRVWIPFHFLPPKRFNPRKPKTFSFLTDAGSEFAGDLLDEAESEPLANHKRRLCRIGVALHTYADTWSHGGFSGRRNRDENDVGGIHVYDRSKRKWQHLWIENVILDAPPQIGHAEAGYFPDLAYARWKCAVGPSEREAQRDNTAEFRGAAETIYDRLCTMEKANATERIPWNELRPAITKLLAQGPVKPLKLTDRLTLSAYLAYHKADLEERCEKWKREFAHLFAPSPERYSYDPETWRKDAIEGDTAWDDYTERDWLEMLPWKLKRGFWDSLWVHFHRAALHQRHFVLENLP